MLQLPVPMDSTDLPIPIAAKYGFRCMYPAARIASTRTAALLKTRPMGEKIKGGRR